MIETHKIETHMIEAHMIETHMIETHIKSASCGVPIKSVSRVQRL